MVGVSVLPMTSSPPEKPYGSASDLPSVKEMEKQITAFKLLGFLLSKEQRTELKGLQREHRRIVSIVDRFYDHLGERNWVFTGDLNLTAMEEVANAKDSETAELRLIAYYNSENRIEFPLGRLHRFDAMRPRIPLLRKALVDYHEGRHYSTVLVLLSVMDGFVNDFDTSIRQGLHARSEEDMVAWDSVAGHHLGLSHAHGSFLKGFYKTDTTEIIDLYRNGIMHGMLVNFDNKTIATKAWNRLFAVADWADSRELRAKPIESTPTLRESLGRWKEIQGQKAKLDGWQPYEYEPSLSPGDPSGVPLICADFLEKWEKRQWALVGAHFMQFGSIKSSVGQLAVEAKDLYKSLDLTYWKLLRIRHTAAAVAHADVELLVNGKTYLTDLRWIHVDSSGTAASDWEEGQWVLSMYGPSHFLKPEAIAKDSGA